MGLGTSSVGIPEISPYTKSEQPRVVGKHLTRHAKNGYAAIAIQQPCVRWPPILGRVGNCCRGRWINSESVFALVISPYKRYGC